MFAEEMELHCSLCMFLYKILTLVKCMLKSCILLAVYSPSKCYCDCFNFLCEITFIVIHEQKYPRIFQVQELCPNCGINLANGGWEWQRYIC